MLFSASNLQFTMTVPRVTIERLKVLSISCSTLLQTAKGRVVQCSRLTAIVLLRAIFMSVSVLFSHGDGGFHVDDIDL